MAVTDYSNDAALAVQSSSNPLTYSPPVRKGTDVSDFLSYKGKENTGFRRFINTLNPAYYSWAKEIASQNEYNQNVYNTNWEANLNSPAVQRSLQESAGSNLFWNGQGSFTSPSPSPSQEYNQDANTGGLQFIGELFNIVSGLQSLRLRKTQIDRGNIENRILKGTEEYKIASAREGLHKLFLGNNKEFFSQFGDQGSPDGVHTLDARQAGYFTPDSNSFFREFLSSKLTGSNLQNTGKERSNERLKLANAFYKAMYTPEYAKTLKEYQDYRNAVSELSAKQAEKLQSHLSEWIDMVVKGYDLNTKKMQQSIKFLGTDKALEIVRGFTGIASDLVGMFTGGASNAIGSMIEHIDPASGEITDITRKTNLY